MALRVELRTRSGEIVAVTGEVYEEIDAMMPPLSAGQFPLLSGVDRYAITMFNSLQMTRLSPEIERLLVDAPPRRAKMLRELQEMCRQGEEIPDAQMWFLGD
jgi:hypothetical protein